MASQGGASRLDTVLKLLLVAFISLLAFSSGVYFGKQMSDSDHQLKALENGAGEKDETSAEVAKSLDQKPGDAVTDEDVTAASEKYMGDGAKDGAQAENEEVTIENHKDAKVAAQSPVVPQAATVPAKVAVKAETAKPDLTEAKKTTERIVQNTKPDATALAKADAREPSSVSAKAVKADMATPQYTVQVASYPTEADAKREASELVKKGFPAYPVEATIKGHTWYRVGVGSFKTQKEATDYRVQLLKQANLTAAIVQKIDR